MGVLAFKWSFKKRELGQTFGIKPGLRISGVRLWMLMFREGSLVVQCLHELADECPGLSVDGVFNIRPE
jgi:hypothetical protein